MPYRTVYKCKLCGLRITSDSTIPDHIADKINSAINELLETSRLHYCPNGDIGIATFIGLAKE